MLEQEFWGIWMLHFIVGYLKNGTLTLIVIWLRLTLLSSPGAIWNSPQLEKKGGSLKTAGPFSVPDAFLEGDALSPRDAFPRMQTWACPWCLLKSSHFRNTWLNAIEINWNGLCCAKRWQRFYFPVGSNWYAASTRTSWENLVYGINDSTEWLPEMG